MNPKVWKPILLIVGSFICAIVGVFAVGRIPARAATKEVPKLRYIHIVDVSTDPRDAGFRPLPKTAASYLRTFDDNAGMPDVFVYALGKTSKRVTVKELDQTPNEALPTDKYGLPKSGGIVDVVKAIERDTNSLYGPKLVVIWLHRRDLTDEEVYELARWKNANASERFFVPIGTRNTLSTTLGKISTGDKYLAAELVPGMNNAKQWLIEQYPTLAKQSRQRFVPLAPILPTFPMYAAAAIALIALVFVVVQRWYHGWKLPAARLAPILLLCAVVIGLGYFGVINAIPPFWTILAIALFAAGLLTWAYTASVPNPRLLWLALGGIVVGFIAFVVVTPDNVIESPRNYVWAGTLGLGAPLIYYLFETFARGAHIEVMDATGASWYANLGEHPIHLGSHPKNDLILADAPSQMGVIEMRNGEPFYKEIEKDREYALNGGQDFWAGPFAILVHGKFDPWTDYRMQIGEPKGGPEERPVPGFLTFGRPGSRFEVVEPEQTETPTAQADEVGVPFLAVVHADEEVAATTEPVEQINLFEAPLAAEADEPARIEAKFEPTPMATEEVSVPNLLVLGESRRRRRPVTEVESEEEPLRPVATAEIASPVAVVEMPEAPKEELVASVAPAPDPWKQLEELLAAMNLDPATLGIPARQSPEPTPAPTLEPVVAATPEPVGVAYQINDDPALEVITLTGNRRRQVVDTGRIRFRFEPTDQR